MRNYSRTLLAVILPGDCVLSKGTNIGYPVPALAPKTIDEDNVVGSFTIAQHTQCAICHHSRHSPHEIETASVFDELDDLTLVNCAH